MNKFKQFTYKFAGVLITVFITCFIIRPFLTQKTDQHNCRFWGIIFSDSQLCPAGTIRTHLDSLQSLGNSNSDGWGIGYYLSPDSGVILPIVLRGEPRAPLDPRYDKAVTDMIKYMRKCGIAHVRSGTSGSTSGIPNPHPFQRYGITRNFQMLFAHNGTISTQVLLELIESVNPVYLALNPPDYEPDYLDSDLYAIYMMEIIDVYYNNTIEECIKIAITKLDSALNFDNAQLNFVMSDGFTLWALRYARSPLRGFDLYYYPQVGISNFWVAASKPLDTLNLYWAAVPNSTLVILTPGEPPQLINIFNEHDTSVVYQGLDLIYPNPFKGKIDIRYCIGQSAEGIELKIYNTNGRLVKQFPLPTPYSLLPTSISWDGTDNKGNTLPNGVYFCNLNTGDTIYTRKMVLLK